MNTGKGISTIYLVRHGECQSNLDSMILSPDVDHLTEKGKLQASLLGKQLKDVTVTHVFASNYPRAQETAELILDQLETAKPETKEDSRIRELELGKFENRPLKDVFDAMFKEAEEKGTRLIDFEVCGGESVQELERRIESFLDDIFKLIRESNQPQTILVVTHGFLVMRMMLKLCFMSKESSRALTLNSFSIRTATIPIKNTAYHTLTVEMDTTSQKMVIDVTKINECGHLDPLKPKVPEPPSQNMVEITKHWTKYTSDQCATV